jgi:hypothetical protein
MEYLRVKNWKKHQHYKGRTPPWIKLHAALLDDYEFECLTDINKIQLIAIWLLASRSREYHPDGDPILPYDEQYLFKKSGLKSKIDLKTLISTGFIICYHSDSGLIADRKQLVPTDLDLETYKEDIETPLSPDGDSPQNGFSPNDMVKIWNDKIKAREKMFDGELDLPVVLKLTPDRRRQCLTRIKSLALNEGKWSDVMEGIYRSKFLVGINDRGWVATFDWITRNDKNVMKVVEGW